MGKWKGTNCDFFFFLTYAMSRNSWFICEAHNGCSGLIIVMKWTHQNEERGGKKMHMDIIGLNINWANKCLFFFPTVALSLKHCWTHFSGLGWKQIALLSINILMQALCAWLKVVNTPDDVPFLLPRGISFLPPFDCPPPTPPRCFQIASAGGIGGLLRPASVEIRLTGVDASQFSPF